MADFNEVDANVDTLTTNVTELIREVGRARKADTPDGTFKLLKESSPNARNECLDALRYGLMSRPWMFVPERDGKRGRWTQGVAPDWRDLDDMVPQSSPPLGTFS